MQVLSKSVIVSCILWECNCFMYNINTDSRPIWKKHTLQSYSNYTRRSDWCNFDPVWKTHSCIFFRKLHSKPCILFTYPKPSSCDLLHRSRCGYLNEKHDSKLLKTFDYILRKHLHLRKDFICEIVLISKRRRRCYRSTISSIYKLKNFSQLFKWKTKPKSPRNI
jgi:hypothetical protein